MSSVFSNCLNKSAKSSKFAKFSVANLQSIFFLDCKGQFLHVFKAFRDLGKVHLVLGIALLKLKECNVSKLFSIFLVSSTHQIKESLVSDTKTFIRKGCFSQEDFWELTFQIGVNNSRGFLYIDLFRFFLIANFKWK